MTSTDSIKAISLGIRVPNLLDNLSMSSAMLDSTTDEKDVNLRKISFRFWC